MKPTSQVGNKSSKPASPVQSRKQPRPRVGAGVESPPPLTTTAQALRHRPGQPLDVVLGSPLLDETLDRADRVGVSVELQQFQIALEVVLGRLSEEEAEKLLREMFNPGGADARLTLRVRELIVTTAMKVGDKRRTQSIPKN